MKYVLALLADWANGIFALLLAAYVTDIEIVWWYIPIAILLSHLPDIDAIPPLVRYGNVSGSAEHMQDHRTFLHYPIVSISLAVLCVYWFGFWGWVVFFNIVLHLINDLYGTGWGLQLFWPLSGRHYKVLGRRVNRLKSILVADGDWGRLPNSDKKLRLVVTWSRSEIATYITRWGMVDWIERWYLKINWINIVEYTLFATACALLSTTLL